MIKNNRIFKYVCITFFGVFILAIIYIIAMGSGVSQYQYVFDEGLIEEWNDNWEVNYDGIIEENVTLPVSVPVKRGNTVIIRKNLPDKIKQYNCLLVASKRQDVIVSIGGIQRVAYSNKGHRAFGKSSPSGVILVTLYNTDSQSDVAIRFSSDSVFSGDISKIFIGSEKSLLFQILKANIIWISLGTIVLIIGLICAVSYIIYGSSFKISKAMIYLAMFAIFSSVWNFTQLGLRQIMANDLSTFELIGYCCYMLIPVPVLLYVNWIMGRKYERFILCGILISISNFIVENLIQCIFKIAFFEMRYVSQIVYILFVLFVLVLCIIESKKEYGTMAKSLSVGVVGLIFGIFQSVPIHGYDYQWGVYNRYILGAFIFLVSGYIYTTTCVRQEQNLRKDAESANLAKTLFLATMSHEIKTPINTVMGMNEMIIRDSSEEVIQEYAAKINDAGKSLLAIINDVLDFSKIESGKMDIICVNYQLKSLLQDLILTTEMRIKEKELKLIIDIDETLPSGYYGDEIRIKQIVTNLLTNAAKYTSTGSITFAVKNRGIKDGEIDLYFSVKDTGSGIKEEDISRFMDSFVRLEQVKNSNIEGTGLGLAITTQLLKLMGSQLEVDSVYGEGSDFHFVLHQKIIDTTPIGKFKEKSERKVKKTKMTFTAPEARVLVVDDNRMNITVAKGLLKPTKMQIESCDSGAKCLELCKDNYYDLIFMDHMMPGIDGIEAFKRLRADKTLKSTDSSVIVLTANTVSGASEMYAEVGFDYYLKKPIDVIELNEVVQKFIPKEMIHPIDVQA